MFVKLLVGLVVVLLSSLAAWFLTDRRYPFPRVVATTAVVFLGIVLLIPVLIGAAETATFNYVFRVLTTEGSFNAWLARVVTVGFVVAVSCGVRLVFTTSKKKHLSGWIVLGATYVAFNLVMYFCTKSLSAVENGQYFVQETGQAKSWYFVSETGDWELFPSPGFHPRNGEELKPMTPEAAKRYEAYQQKKTEEEQQRQRASAERAEADAEHRFRETYVNEGALARRSRTPPLLLAIQVVAPGSTEDAIQSELAKALAKGQGQERIISGVFKPAFYKDHLFDQIWEGDLAAASRLRLFDGPGNSLLLTKASFSEAKRTELDDVVSVRGELHVVRLTKDQRVGPVTFTATGAGLTPANATETCAKRLSNVMDLSNLFPK